jgi:glutamyl-tRNA reductase
MTKIMLSARSKQQQPSLPTVFEMTTPGGPDAEHLHHTLEHFLVLGTGFTKADSHTRSRFAVTREQADRFYRLTPVAGLSGFAILSTCNRTEFYAVGSAAALRQLVARQLQLSDNELTRYFYLYHGHRAVEHFFRVTAGLESQILGDYEIVCQVKAAIEQARAHNCVNTLLDRVANFALQAARKVKTQTNLSNGKYSVSYAVAELLLHRHETCPIGQVLLIGAGDFGTTVARNLRQYFPGIRLTLSNRTHEKAEALAQEVSAETMAFGLIEENLHRFDAVICAAGSGDLLIRAAHIPAGHAMVLIDLCVPQTIDPQMRLAPGISLYSVDEVSAFHNDLLAKRQQEVPEAEKIIGAFTQQLLQWHEVYAHRALISSYKTKIRNLWRHRRPGVCGQMDEAIDETFGHFIKQMKSEGYAGCRMIAAVNKLVPAAP